MVPLLFKEKWALDQILNGHTRFLERLPKRHIAHTSIHLEDSIERFGEYLLSQRMEVYPFIPHIIDTTFKGNEEVFEITLNYLEK